MTLTAVGDDDCICVPTSGGMSAVTFPLSLTSETANSKTWRYAASGCDGPDRSIAIEFGCDDSGVRSLTVLMEDFFFGYSCSLAASTPCAAGQCSPFHVEFGPTVMTGQSGGNGHGCLSACPNGLEFMIEVDE